MEHMKIREVGITTWRERLFCFCLLVKGMWATDSRNLGGAASGNNVDDSILSKISSQATATVSSVQVGLDSLYNRLREGESLGSIISQGLWQNPIFPQANSTSSTVATGIMTSAWSLENPVFRSFALASGVLGTKLVVNSVWTTYHRVQRKVFSTPEDIPAFGGTAVINDDDVVERIRRMHMNDLENFTPFFILGLLYVATEPDQTEANILFRLFVACRLAHSVCHAGLKTQPGRFMAFLGGWSINAFLAYKVLRRVF